MKTLKIPNFSIQIFKNLKKNSAEECFLQKRKRYANADVDQQIIKLNYYWNALFLCTGTKQYSNL